MAFRFDTYDDSLVVDGFQKGIADSPFDGIADMRNVNIISVPGEASVNFATQIVSSSAISSGTVVSADAATDTVTYTGATGLEAGMAVVFAGGSLPTGIVAGTVYWIGNLSGGTFKLYTDLRGASGPLLDITATGTGTFTTFTMNQPMYFSSNLISGVSTDFMIDALGQVWTNFFTSSSGYWIYTGNNGGSGNKSGNGLVQYQASDNTVYLFAFRNSCIDYLKISNTGFATGWIYGWNPLTGAAGSYTTLKTANGTGNLHEAMVAPDSMVYFTDANWIGRWYQTDPLVAFNPTTPSTYTFDQTALLPTTDIAQCLTFLGTNLLIGGIKNVIYPWDRFDTHFTYPILLAEYNVAKMVTVNTNTYIFVGNRGRIYVTNGSNVRLYKKIPDHISGTIEPYFTWGGATSAKNQLYFSASATTNGNSSLSQYGGVWAVDLDTTAIRLTNKLSYATYAGYATALISIITSNPGGSGLYIGWNNGASGYGIDQTIGTPYTSSQAIIDSDLIPIGTFNKPRDFTTVEYRLTRPLVNGESVTIKTRVIFNTSDTGYTTTLTDATVGNWSSSGSINIKNAQWIQFQIVLNSTASTPSYTRLKEIRVAGITP